MTKKLKILGPYTPEHEGPFCTREGVPVEVKIRDGRGVYEVYGYIGNEQSMSAWTADGRIIYDCKTQSPHDLMNAREVPVAREFWVNEYAFYNATLHEDEGSAKEASEVKSFIRTIHVREVLPGEE